MSIEHIGISVDNPFKMADWYVKNLNFKILVKRGSEHDGVVFIEDSKGGTVLELYNAPSIKKMDLFSLEPLLFHIAIEAENPLEKSEEPVKAGAKFEGESIRNTYKGKKFLVRDPWGLCMQILNRMHKLK